MSDNKRFVPDSENEYSKNDLIKSDNDNSEQSIDYSQESTPTPTPEDTDE